MKWWDANIVADSFLVTLITVAVIALMGAIVYCLYNLTVGWPFQTLGFIGGFVLVWLFWYVLFYWRR